MTDKINHAEEAQKLIKRYGNVIAPSAELVSGLMQAHATLALVEQKRITNLFLLHATVPVGNLTERAREELNKAFPLYVGSWEEELGL